MAHQQDTVRKERVCGVAPLTGLSGNATRS
jgi:hypothetical protein